MSGVEDAVPVRHSASVTTGQGGDAFGNWMALGLSNQATANRLGNNRAPAPTCNIPAARVGKTILPSDSDQAWTTIKVADSVLGAENHLPQALASSIAMNLTAASGSFGSSHEQITMGTADIVALSDDAKDCSLPNMSDDSDEDDEQDAHTMKASTPAHRRSRKGREKKKVGRPIAYRGDPNAPELTDLERRRIKRRIANRESARRVRHKRQEELEDMQIKMEQIQSHNTQLQHHADQIKTQKDMLGRQLGEMMLKNDHLMAENKQLTIEIHALRQSLQLKMSALEDELDKRANEAGDTVIHSAFGSAAVQCQPVYPPMALETHETGHFPEIKTDQSAALEWFPSLNMDDPRALEMLNCLLDDPSSSQPCIKSESVCN